MQYGSFEATVLVSHSRSKASSIANHQGHTNSINVKALRKAFSDSSTQFLPG
jgi:hypothetical protein